MKKLTVTILSLFVLIFFTANSFAQAASLSDGGTSAVSSLKEVKYLVNADGQEEVAIYLDSYQHYNVFRLANPGRIVIDISNTYFSGRQQVIDVNSKSVKAVRYAQFDKNTARVVLDIIGEPGYRIQQEADRLLVHIEDGPASDVKRTEGDNASDSGKEENDVSGGSAERPASKGSESGLASRGGTDRQRISINKNFNIEYASNGDKDEVVISLGSYKDYNVMRLTDPDRIVIDIPKVSIPRKQQKIDVNSNLIRSIRYAKFQKDIARVVLDVTAQSQFKVNEKTGQLILDIENPAYKNITYHNSGDRVYFSLKGAKLTEGGEDLKKFYKEKYDLKGKKYTITFPSQLADLESGEMVINDGLLKSVEIVKDTSAMNTSITFNAKGKLVYRVFTRPDVNDTAITILKPVSKYEKLVVIDAGHGGLEPGAIYGSLKEKDLNLDIAERLNNLLKSKKIKTYMIREDDSFVALYERAYIANDLNATLFLSIHNNAMGDSTVGGTMTLYYPPRSSSESFNGKVFAQIIQNSLLGKLKTADRRIIERPNLVVLKATTMPSALAEVAFMTNAQDRNNLQDPGFRQKAAQALYDALIKALKKAK